jgi:enoyl-CoA hydratase
VVDELSVDDVRLSVRGGIGRITLDRPKAMNALSHAMVVRVDGALQAWETDAAVDVVLIDGVGERGLCAGGDVKMFHASALGDGSAVRAFWAAEYRMNARIAAYPKPVVALMFGTVLGGGVGVSAHAHHRVVTESSSVGMPEVGIGFFPDVGCTWLLARAPGELGLYLALTGLPVGPGDAVLCGLADVYVTGNGLDGLRAAGDATGLLAAIAAGAAAAPEPVLAARREWIDACFAAPTAGQIVDRLRATGLAEAVAAAELIQSRSPGAVELTLLGIRQARDQDTLDAALDVEYAMAVDSLRRPDFVEGIRAQVIDKDRNPRWRPATLGEVDVAALQARFTAWTQTPPERPI